MKNKIIKEYPDSTFGETNAPVFYVADFTERTGNVRGVEVLNSIPADPNNNDVEMDCCCIKNTKELMVDYNIFDDTQFVDEDGKMLKHGECCMFPHNNNAKTWLLFIEIKDCKGSRIGKYKKNVKEKSIKNVEIFRDKKIITDNNVYCIASFPRKKTAFNEMIVTDPTEYKKFYKEHGFRFVPTNEVSIKDDAILEFYKKP